MKRSMVMLAVMIVPSMFGMPAITHAAPSTSAATPAIRASDLPALYGAWSTADLAAWKELNVGNAVTIARAEG
ncbi:MAG TPA: hypothetical protein VF720_10060, partial [Candidatus Eisenbacteria bacterium]